MNNDKFLLTLVLAFVMFACNNKVEIAQQTDDDFEIYPDYKGVTLPCNIAPLNFNVEGAEGEYALSITGNGEELCVKARNGDFDIPEKRWKRLLQKSKGQSLVCTVAKKESGKWVGLKPFEMYVSPDSIERMLAYRLLPPLYGTWMEMGIYQRDLESFEQKAIYENDVNHGNCVNCHSFCSRDAEKMLFHMRGAGGATYLKCDGLKERLNTKTDSTISSFTYPYWHPSGRYVAFSVNDIFQVFHTSDRNRIEVCDDASDIIVYDIYKNEAFSSPLLKREGILETFPAFSADGCTLYFCSAELPNSLPEQYKDVHYSLLSIPFNPETGTFGEKVDTLYDAKANGKSVSFPRPSPDGTKLVATLASYGNFSIWHKDADLIMFDLSDGSYAMLDNANSDDVESYHSWSGNSRWLVFSSRRDDGLYTRPYIVNISADGIVGKPFILPQRHPKQFYKDLMYSYNIPELVNAPIELTPREVSKWIENPESKVNYRKSDLSKPGM